MKKVYNKIWFVVLLWIVVSCSSNSSYKNKQFIKKEKQEIPKENKNTIQEIKRGELIQLNIDNDQYSESIVFDTISEKEFNQVNKKKSSIKIKIRRTPKVIDISTAVQTHQLNHYNANSIQSGDRGYEILDYNSSIKIYSLHHYFQEDDFNFTKLLLIDSLTDYQYEFDNDRDIGFEKPVFSRNNSFFAIFSNDIMQEVGSTLVIVKLKSKENPKTLFTLKKAYSFNDITIESLCWKNDNILLLKCYEIVESENEKVKKSVYLKTTIQ